MTSTREAINWWEKKIDSNKRNEIFDKNVGKGKSWSDIGESTDEGIKKRHAWLSRMYKKYGGRNSSQAA